MLDRFPGSLLGLTLAALFAFGGSHAAAQVPLAEDFNALSGWTVTGTGRAQAVSGQLDIAATSSGQISAARPFDVPAVYNLQFRLAVNTYGSQQFIAVVDGDYMLVMYFAPNGVYVRNQSNVLTQVYSWSSSTAWHNYTLAVNKGIASINIDGTDCGKVWLTRFVTTTGQGPQIAASGTPSAMHVEYFYMDALAPIAEQFNTLSRWTKSGTGTAEIASAQLHMSTQSLATTQLTRAVTIDSTYHLTFRAKVDSFGTKQSIAVLDGGWRLQLVLRSGGVMVVGSSGSEVNVFPWSSSTTWHDYEAVVANGFATLYVDGVRRAALALPTASPGDRAEISVQGPASELRLEDFNLIHETYIDTFEDESTGALPSHFMQSVVDENWNTTANHWKVISEGTGAKAFRADELTSYHKALLHTFGDNVQFSADFRINQISSQFGFAGYIGFLVRSNRDEDRTEVRYQFSDKKWHIRNQDGINDTIHETVTTTAFNYSGWNRIKVITEGNAVGVWINGTGVLLTAGSSRARYGRVGFQVAAAEVDFDNVVYRGDGEGRVHDGVKEFGGMHSEGEADFVQLSNGLITTHTVQQVNGARTDGLLQTSNNGTSWTFSSTQNTGFAGKNLNYALRTRGGKLIHFTGHFELSNPAIGREYFTSNTSTDDGRTWSPDQELGPIPSTHLNSYWNTAIQSASGRLFVPVNYERQGAQIYYSDDDGAHWTFSKTDVSPPLFPGLFYVNGDPAAKKYRIEDGDVVDCGTNKVASFFRTNRDYHYRMLSTDNGVTFSTPAQVTDMRAALSDSTYVRDPNSNDIYAMWIYDASNRATCASDGQWPRERMVLGVSSDCGATWKYLMDIENWEGNNARYNEPLMRMFGNYIYLSVAQKPNFSTECFGNSTDENTQRRIFVIDKSKQTAVPMPPLLTRGN